MRCPTCYREIGTQCEPGPLNDHPILSKAGIGQWCKDCATIVPKKVIADMISDPQGFIDRWNKKMKYDNAKRIMKGVEFPDNRTVIHAGHDPRIAVSHV